jgi:hypothetical protein
MKTLRLIVATAVCLPLVLLGPAARADCVGPPPSWLRFEEMIELNATGRPAFPILALGKVDGVRDAGGRPGGGWAFARVLVAADPIAPVGDVVRIRFWREFPGTGSSGTFEFVLGDRYAVVARRTDEGHLKFDGGCGQTKQLGRARFQELVHLARRVQGT